MKKFILFENNDDNEPTFEIVESTSAPKALLDYLTEIFNLDDEELSEDFICEDMMMNEFFAVAPVELGNIDFQYYYNIKELKEEIQNGK